jgi:hypothetical protein
MLRKLVQLFTNRKTEKKKVKKLVDLSNTWYLNVGGVFVAQRELDIKLLEESKNQEKMS